MSNAIATVALAYDATDLQEVDLQWHFEIVAGLGETPKVRGTDSLVPALAGRIEGLRVNDVLPIELAGHVRHDPALTDLDDMMASYADNRLLIRTLFRPNRSRADLIAVQENGDPIFIAARPLNIIWKETIPGLFAAVSVTLEGYDDWQSGS